MKIKSFIYIGLLPALLVACRLFGSSDVIPKANSPSPPTLQQPTEAPPPEIAVGSVLLTGDGNEVTITKLDRFGSQSCWAVGSRQGAPDLVLYSLDGGQSWADRTPPDPTSQGEAVTSFWDANTGLLIYIGSNLLWKTTDAGMSWIPNTLDAESIYGGLIDILDQNTAWVMLFSNVGGPRNEDITLYRTLNGGTNWILMLDPSDFGSTVHGFEKTGFSFGTADYGWIGRETMGFFVDPPLDITRDGGRSWESITFPPAPDFPGLFNDCRCGVYDTAVTGPGVGSFHLSCECYGDEKYPYTQFDYTTTDDGETWIITAIAD